MEVKGLRPSSFADKAGISRSTISQILGDNGRKNDPSVSTIERILEAFPDISRTWFYSGEGAMYNSKQLLIKPVSSSMQQDLFGENTAVESSTKPRESGCPQKTEDKKPEKILDQSIIQEVNLSNNISKKIDRIMIFFSDKTFMTFISEE